MADLQAAVHKARPKLYPARQRFTLPKKNGEKKPVALAGGKRLADYDLTDGTELTFKDLGPQARCPLLQHAEAEACGVYWRGCTCS